MVALLAPCMPLWQARTRASRPHFRCTLACLLVIGSITLSQLTFEPALLVWFERDADAIETGQVFRLFTAALVQDGGPGGALFNLVSLAVVGWTAEQRWSPATWLTIALLGSLSGNLAGLLVQPVGAGNSAMVFALAASLASSTLRAQRGRCFRSAMGLGVGLVLLCRGDLHGFAAMAGALCGSVSAPRARTL